MSAGLQLAELDELEASCIYGQYLGAKNIVVVPALLLEAQDHRWIQDLLDIIQLNESTYHFGNWLRSQQISEEALMGQWKKMRQQQQKIFVEI